MVPKPECKALYLVIYIVTIITGFPSNLLALHALIHKLRSKPTPNAILLFNLTVSDLSFLAFLPFKVAEVLEGHWSLPSFLCPLSGLFYFSTIYSSTLFLTAVSVERYLGVAFPIKYKMYRKPGYAIAVSCFLWLCSFAHCSIVYITEYQYRENSSQRFLCYDNFTKEQLKILLPFRLELGITLFCIPFIVTTYCYFSFVKILISSPHIHREKKQRAVGLVLATVAVFIICFAPYNISHVVGYIQQENPSWRDEALLLSTLNACLDPIIFYFSSSAVQNSCKKCLQRLYMCNSFLGLCQFSNQQAAKENQHHTDSSQAHISRL
ncbi:free fatty acid receptor 2 [Microcaecilia unicolor]|uniref:Free fatty acid receptor 2-like n=1 Tax=Microcaecilia unicolor TaxID=1415580 RepID=A0A6P7YLG3_9AMPH|nr:free fatty acid receptor 2-like [Microcaecilia unicolor]XP_030068244.1 free fatty acid receptor 2-like [Microcaecilia unicolor]